MRVINHNWSATKQRPHPQSVAEISRHSVLSADRICPYTPATKSTHGQQSQKPTRLTKSKVDMGSSTFDFVADIAVDIVAKVEHVQLGRHCRKWVIFVARMSNILSTLSPVCMGPVTWLSFHKVDRVKFDFVTSTGPKTDTIYHSQYIFRSPGRTTGGITSKIQCPWQTSVPVKNINQIRSAVFKAMRPTPTDRQTDNKLNILNSTVGDIILRVVEQQEMKHCLWEKKTRGQSDLTKSVSRGAHSPARGHPRGSKVVPLNSWGRVSY